MPGARRLLSGAMFRPGPPRDRLELPERFRFGAIEVDVAAVRVRRDGATVALEPKAFDLLLLLAANPGRVVEKEEIFERIWTDTVVTDNALARVVAHLRRELGDSAEEARVIETVRTRGYRFLPEIRAFAAAEPATAERAEVAARRRPARRLALWALVAMTALAALAAIGGWLLRMRHAGERAWFPVLQPLTQSRGFEGMAALSPDGAAVAFVSDRTGPLELYVVGRAPGSRPVRITQDGGQNVQPAWSPDGQWLAFHSLRSGGIWVVPAGGGTARQVAPVGSAPAWSPDSRRLVFSSSEGSASQATLWQVDRDGARLSQLTQRGAPAGGHHGPTWSPDGRTIAFGVFSLRTAATFGADHKMQLAEIWLLDLRTGGSRRFTTGPNYGHLQFASDGRSLYWGGLSREGNPRLFRAPLDASGEAAPEQVLALHPGWLDSLSVSRDGTAALGISDIDANLWQVATSGETAGVPERLTDDSSRTTLPSYSPDGSRLAFSVLAIGRSHSVWTMRAAGGERDLLGEGYQAEWDPGGGRLLVSSIGDFYWLDLATRRRGKALPLPRGAERLRLSPDGQAIAFHVESISRPIIANFPSGFASG